MKKYLFGLFAIALAIGSTAFTHGKHQSKSASALHYYFVDESLGTVGSYIGDYDPAISQDWTTLKSDASCNDNQSAPVCAKGFAIFDPTDQSTGTNPLKRTN